MKHPYRLRKLLREEFSCVFFGDKNTLLPFIELTRCTEVDFPVNYIAVIPRDGKEMPEFEGVYLADYDDVLASRTFYCGTPVIFIVRPDMHIAGSYKMDRTINLKECLNRFAHTLFNAAIIQQKNSN